MDLEFIKEKLPKTAMISKICFEGSDVVIFTKNKEFFVEGSDKVKEIVTQIRKRIEIRPDPAISKDPEESKEIVMKIIPKDAEVKDILFEPEFGRMVILAQKPGIAIGKGGEILREIKKQTCWSPKIQRVPLFSSNIVNKAREIVHNESAYRQKFLNRIGEKIQLEKGSKEGWVRLSALGGCREVGRSCFLLQTKESKVLLDCGTSVSGSNNHPFIDAPEFDLDSLDAVIVSHAHLDHCGFIPYLYEYEYKGPVYCTLPTRDVMTLLCLDYIDVIQREGGTAPYTSKGIKNAIKHSITLGYGEVCDITPDMRLTFQNAGHILGSALSHIHIGEGLYNLLYTGDMKFGPTKLFEPAYTDFNRIETLLLESTYGGPNDVIPSKREADENLIRVMLETLERKGKVIVPAFSVGRSQEIMIVLAEYAARNNLEVPVYLDGMIWDGTAIHTAYPEFLSRQLQRMIFHQGNNPFTSKIFKEVKGSNDRKKIIEEKDPSIIVTTSGMISGGPIMEYLRHLADKKNNTLIFVGFQAEGTLGSRIQRGWREVPLQSNEEDKRNILKINLDIQTVEGFSGHSDKNQLISYVSNLRSRPERILLNHGELSKSLNLAKVLHNLFKVETSVPHNLDACRLK